VCFDWGDTLMVDDGPTGVPMERWSTVTAVPGAPECLAALHGRVPLCIATNAEQSDRSMIARALERVELDRFIDRIFCFADVGFRKGHPEFWHAVGAELGLPPVEIVMIGDSLEHDVLAPARAGVQTVWFSPPERRVGAAAEVLTVADLGRFAEMVGALLKRPPPSGRRIPPARMS
jgi:aminoglycoside 6'-N-acetyltransferase I